MQITTAIVQETVKYYDLGNGMDRWSKKGFTAILDPGEDPIEASKKLSELVQIAHNQSIPPTTPTLQVDKKNDNEKDALIHGIVSCTEVDGAEGLKSYEIRARNTPGAMEIYNANLERLLKGKPTDKQIAKSHRRSNGTIKMP